MNDDELMTAVRESFTGVHSRTPVETIVSRSRAVRARRRIPGMAGALAVAAGAAIAVTTLPGSHQPSHPVTARLAAWTVTKQADGDIAVTIRELRDPAGLQRTLRADGVPASVRFFPSRHQPNPCQGYDGSQRLYHKVLHELRPGNLGENSILLIIHPSALPHGAGVGLQVTGIAGNPQRPGLHSLGIALVQASPQCTGS
jgi:hypothetical protein